MSARLKARLHDVLVNLAAHPVAFPLARLSARLSPLHRVPGVGVVVNDAELAHDILGRDRDFTKNGPGSLAAVFTQAMGPFALSNMDGEAHRELRSRLGDLLSPARCEGLLSACRGPLDEGAGALVAGAEVDLVRMMRTLSGRLTMAMIGVVSPPEGERATDEAAREVFALGERIAAALRFAPLPEEALRPVQGDIDRLTRMARESYASAALPETSLMHRLREMGMPVEEARGVISIFFIAGALTTAVALPRIVALLVDSEQMAGLGDDADRVARAIDEGLRFTTPVPATVRVAQRDAEVRGRRIRGGSRVVILTSNLARDAALFPDPHRFDAARVHDARARYLWYGAGPHFCFGFPLAQRELRLALGVLAALPGRLRIVRRRAARGVLLPSYARLLVRLEGR